MDSLKSMRLQILKELATLAQPCLRPWAWPSSNPWGEPMRVVLLQAREVPPCAKPMADGGDTAAVLWSWATPGVPPDAKYVASSDG